MIKHPDGTAITNDLLNASGIHKSASILDLGAGDGDSVRLLRSLGFNAEGIDLSPGSGIISGDITSLPFVDESFDAALAECTFSVCGDAAGAFREARRVLSPSGLLMLSDVYYKAENAPALSLPCPATKDGWIKSAVGFELLYFADRTDVWTDYIIDCVWHGKDIGDCGFYKAAAKSKCGYFISVWKKV